MMRDRGEAAALRRGITLVELLVVIGVIALLMAVSIPLIRPAFRDRKLREASRGLNAFLQSAKARAAELGRPVGVWIERSDVTELGSRQAVRAFLCQVPPAFTGALVFSRVAVEPAGLSPQGQPQGWLQFSPVDAALLRDLVSPGETFTIRLDYRGPLYPAQRLTNPPGPNQEFAAVFPGGIPPGAVNPSSLPFQIFTGPKKTGAEPLELPGETVIDLAWSGLGASGVEFDPALMAPGTWDGTPVIILFNPDGSVGSVFVRFVSFPPVAPIHLLLGRTDQVVNPATAPLIPTDPDKDPLPNLMDSSAIWVTINHLTGDIHTSENADTLRMPLNTTLPDRIRAAREFARSAVRIGGR